MFLNRHVAVVGCLLAVLAGDMSAAPAQLDDTGSTGKKIAAGAIAEQLLKQFRQLDSDGDEKLTERELGPALFSVLNTDNDKHVTLDEARAVDRATGAEVLRTLVERPTSAVPSAATGSATATPAKGDVPSIRQGPKRLIPGDHGVGRMVPDIALTDIHGESFQLSDLKTCSAVVLAMTNTSCPLSKKYAPTLATLEKQFQSRNVAFVYVNATPSDKPDVIQEAIRLHGLLGHYVVDHDGELATLIGATHTTDAVVLDSRRTVVYRGAVDDQYGAGYAKDQPRETYLANALEEVLAEQRVRVSATSAPGCPLDLEPAGVKDSGVTYHNRISRIVQSHCLECHRDGGVAPFALSTYEEVAGQSGAIRRVINEGIMPPWFAAAPAPGQPSPFANDCSLAEADKSALLQWLNGGKPEGNPADAPLPRSFHEGWQIGKPDYIVQLPQPISVKATGTMPYQNVTIESGLTETRYLKALEVRPTAREVVHHVLVFVLPPESANAVKDDEHDEGGTSGFFAAYAPGYDALVFNEGFGKTLPAGSRLKFQIHYTPNGVAASDQPMLGMIFLDEKPEKLVDVTGVVQPRFAIPPGDANYEVVATQAVPQDATILAFFPHMHLRGKAFRYDAVLPDGTLQTLLNVPRYDFNWQLSYRLAEPVTLPAGSTLKATAVFDNSADNPANPDPTKTVRWGQQTYDEMMIGYVEYHMPTGRLGRNGISREQLKQLAAGKGIEQLFRRLDTDNDGKITGDEFPAEQKDRLLKLDSDQDGSLSLVEAMLLPKLLERKN